MTEEQRKQTDRLREEGFGYGAIAKLLGLPHDTVKSYCRRHGLTGRTGFKQKGVYQRFFCKECGLPVQQNVGRKEKKFCSDTCRNRWWNAHLDLVNHRAYYQFECEYCHKQFKAYGNAKRKYCCHECYVADRFHS